MTNKCPECQHGPVQTALCYSYNPIFNCFFAFHRVQHVHHYCNCGATWIEIPTTKWTPANERQAEGRFNRK